MNNETKEFLYKRLKSSLQAECRESYISNKKEKNPECRFANAMARRILSNISRETLIELIISLRWQVVERDGHIEIASNKILDLTRKIVDYKLKLNKIYCKKEGDING